MQPPEEGGGDGDELVMVPVPKRPLVARESRRRRQVILSLPRSPYDAEVVIMHHLGV
jgi:hypothetical protein